MNNDHFYYLHNLSQRPGHNDACMSTFIHAVQLFLVKLLFFNKNTLCQNKKDLLDILQPCLNNYKFQDHQFKPLYTLVTGRCRHFGKLLSAMKTICYHELRGICFGWSGTTQKCGLVTKDCWFEYQIWQAWVKCPWATHLTTKLHPSAAHCFSTWCQFVVMS